MDEFNPGDKVLVNLDAWYYAGDPAGKTFVSPLNDGVISDNERVVIIASGRDGHGDYRIGTADGRADTYANESCLRPAEDSGDDEWERVDFEDLNPGDEFKCTQVLPAYWIYEASERSGHGIVESRNSPTKLMVNGIDREDGLHQEGIGLHKSSVFPRPIYRKAKRVTPGWWLFEIGANRDKRVFHVDSDGRLSERPSTKHYSQDPNRFVRVRLLEAD